MDSKSLRCHFISFPLEHLVAQAGVAPAPPGLQPGALLTELPRVLLEPTGGLEPPSPGYETGALPVELYRPGSEGRIRTCIVSLNRRSSCRWTTSEEWQRVEESNPWDAMPTTAFEAVCLPTGGTLCDCDMTS